MNQDHDHIYIVALGVVDDHIYIVALSVVRWLNMSNDPLETIQTHPLSRHLVARVIKATMRSALSCLFASVALNGLHPVL